MSETPKVSFNEISAYWAHQSEVECWGGTADHPIARPDSLRGIHIRERFNALSDDLERAVDIVDLGSGIGFHAYANYAPMNKVTAIDASPELLARNPSREKRLADLREGIPLADASQDIAISMFLCRYLDQPAFMKEVLRVLRPGGRFLLVDHTHALHPLEIGPFDPYRLIAAFRDNIESGYEIDRVLPQLYNIESYQLGISFGTLYWFTGKKAGI